MLLIFPFFVWCIFKCRLLFSRPINLKYTVFGIHLIHWDNIDV